MAKKYYEVKTNKQEETEMEQNEKNNEQQEQTGEIKVVKHSKLKKFFGNKYVKKGGAIVAGAMGTVATGLLFGAALQVGGAAGRQIGMNMFKTPEPIDVDGVEVGVEA